MTDNMKKVAAPMEKLFQNLFASMNEGLAICEIILDKSGRPNDYRYLEVNPAFEKIMGVTAVQVIGRNRREFGETDPHWLALFGQVVKTGESASQVDYSSDYGKWFDLRAFPLGGEKFAFLFMDITERQQEQHFGQALNDINEIIYSKLKFDEIMNKIIIAAVKNVGCETAAISLGRTGDWTLAHCYGFPEEMVAGSLNRENPLNKGPEPITELVIKTKQPIMIPDAFTNPRVNHEQAKKWNIRSLMALPLIIEDQVMGVIFFNYHQRTFNFSPSYINFVTKLAATISLAIKNAQLFTRVRIELTERKQAEQALQESQQKYQALIETNVDFIWEMDAEGRYTYCSPQMEKLWGIKPGEMIGKTPFNVMPATKRESGVEVFRNVANSPQPFRGLESTALDGQGRLIFTETSGVPYFDGQGGLLGYRGITRDITERKKMEEALRKSEENYRELVESSNSIILRVDKNLNITFINEFAQRFLGYTAVETIGKPVVGTIVPPANSAGQNLAAMSEDIIRNPDNYVNNVHENMRKNGELVWISWTNKALYDDQGNLTEILSIGNDITELKQIERTLEISEARFKSIFDSSPIGIELYDFDGRLIHVNQSCIEIFGVINVADIYKFSLFHDPNLPKDARDKLDRGEVTEFESSFDFNLVKELGLYNTSKSGIIHIHVIISPLFSEQPKKIENYLVQVQDITERKRAEEALREAFHQVEKNQLILETILQQMPAGIIITDASGEVAKNNEEMDRIWRRNMLPVENIDHHAYVGYHADGREYRFNEWPLTRSLRQGETIIGEEMTILRGDGTKGVVYINSAPIRDKSGAIIAGVVIDVDITERKKAEEALRDSEERFRIAVKNSSFMLSQFDCDLRYLWIYNPHPDFDPAQMIGKNDQELEDSEGMRRLYALKRKVIQNGKGVRDEISFHFSDGIHTYDAFIEPLYNEAGVIIGGTASALDITAHKREKEALLESEERLKALMNHNPSLVFLKDEEGRYVYLNDTYEKQFIGSKDWYGKTDFDFWPKESAELFRQNDAEVLKSGQTHQFLEDSTDLEGTRYCWLCYKFSFTDSKNRSYLGGIGINATERIIAEEALKASEQKFKSMFESSPFDMALMSLDGAFIDLNNAALELHGYSSKDELIGQNCFSLVDPEYHHEVARRWEETLRKGYVQNIELKQLRKNGQRIDTLVGATSLKDSEGKPYAVLAMVQDITERKQAEAALIQSNQKVHDLLESIQDDFYALDRDWNFVYVNQKFAARFGKRPQDLLGKNVWETFPKHVGTIYDEQTRAVMDKRELRRFEWQGRYTDAWYMLTAFPLQDGIGVMGAEITERKRMEEELRESEQQYRELVKYAPVGIYEIDFRTMRLKSANDAMCLLTGYTKDELLGMNPFDLLNDEGKNFFQERTRKWLAGVKSDEHVLYTIKAKDGHEILADLLVTFTTDEQGVPLGAIVIGQDITERKRAEEALRESEERFRTFVQQSRDGIIILNSQGHVLEWNEAEEAITGITRSETLGRPLWEIQYKLAPEEKRTVTYATKTRETIINGLKEGISLKRILEDEIQRADGSRRIMQSSLFAIRSGREVLACGVCRDITDQKRLETALRESEEKYRKIVTTANEGICLTDSQGKITYANEILLKWLGYKVEEFLGKEVLDFIAPEDLALSIERLETRKAGISERYDSKLRKKDGGYIWLIVSGTPLYDEQGKYVGILTMFMDITERKRIEEEQILLESYRRNNEILESITDSFYALDHELRFIYVNNGAEKAWGLSRSVLIDHKISEIFPNLIDFSLEKFNRVLQEQTPEHYELYSKVTNTWVEMHVYPTGNGISVYFRDISNRKQMENSLLDSQEALSAERELLKVTLNSLCEGVLATDQDEKIILINQAAANLTGYPAKEAMGQPLPLILNLLDDKTSEPVNQILTHAPFSQFILCARDGRKMVISFSISAIKTTNDQIIGRVIVFQDITEKQRTDRELLKTEKLESLGILAGGIAHDFNNLLGAILSNIQLAQMKYKKNANIEKYLQESVDATRRASDLTRQLLTFAKGGAPIKKAASLSELIKDTATFALRGSNVKEEFQISETLWPVEADTGQISQVIHNLVINAKQAMPKGGVLQITAENITLKSDLRFEPGNYIKVSIKDQGPGIPKENLPKIFDPFFTTKKEGSGLGLTTSYSIIRRHDGYLDVESEAGAGTTFLIYLPALLAAVNATETPDEIAVTNQGIKILFMEDESAILKSVGEMLEHYGHQVVLTSEGLKTIEEYRKAMEDGAPFDVVIMDLTIPGGMGGQEAITQLREIDPNIRAIVSSGYANDPIISEYERFGFCGVVTKPYKIDELNQVLYRVLGER